MEKKTFVLNESDKAIIAADIEKAYTIKDYAGNGIIMDIESVISAIEKAGNAIINDNGKGIEILRKGNGKIDSSVLCQGIFPVISCPCHCKGCYAVNACTKKFNGIGKQTATAWYKWYFLEKYYPDIYFMQIDREMQKTKAEEIRLHVSGDFIDDSDIRRWIEKVNKYSGIKVYTYTKRNAKRDNMPSLVEFMSLPNVNIVDSLPCGMINYGNAEYLEKLAAKVKAETGETLVVCKCGTEIEKAYNKEHDKKNGGNGSKYCGGKCKACRDCKYIAFIEHK